MVLTNIIASTLSVLARIIEIYSWVLLARVFISWFVPNFKESSWGNILAKITDPFLAPFYKITWLNIGGIHFGYIAAFITLSALRQLLFISALFVSARTFSLSLLGWFGASVAVGFFQSVFIVFGVMALVRLITLFVSPEQSVIGRNLDAILNTLTMPMRRFFGFGAYAYHYALGLVIALAIAGYFGSMMALNYTGATIRMIMSSLGMV
jgi:YggT family protein